MAIGMIVADGNEIDPAVVDPAAWNSLMDLDVSAGSLDDVTAGNARRQRGVRRGPRPHDGQRDRRVVRRRRIDRAVGRRHLRHERRTSAT